MGSLWTPGGEVQVDAGTGTGEPIDLSGLTIGIIWVGLLGLWGQMYVDTDEIPELVLAKINSELDSEEYQTHTAEERATRLALAKQRWRNKQRVQSYATILQVNPAAFVQSIDLFGLKLDLILEKLFPELLDRLEHELAFEQDVGTHINEVANRLIAMEAQVGRHMVQQMVQGDVPVPMAGANRAQRRREQRLNRSRAK